MKCLGGRNGLGPKRPRNFGKSLHRTDRLVYRFLTLNFVSFLPEISTRQLFTIANSNGGVYRWYTDVTLLELFALHTHEFCLRFCAHTNLIAYSRCFNWVNTQIRCLSGTLASIRVCSTYMEPPSPNRN